MTGEAVGPYEVGEKLGEGGMGVVYRAHDKRLLRSVALKFLSGKGQSPASRRRFLREAQIASALNHPGIVTIHDIGEHGGETYIVMEYVEGKPLRELISRKGMEAASAYGCSPPLEHPSLNARLQDGKGALGMQRPHGIGLHRFQFSIDVFEILHTEQLPGTEINVELGLIIESNHHVNFIRVRMWLFCAQLPDAFICRLFNHDEGAFRLHSLFGH